MTCDQSIMPIQSTDNTHSPLRVGPAYLSIYTHLCSLTFLHSFHIYSSLFNVFIPPFVVTTQKATTLSKWLCLLSFQLCQCCTLVLVTANVLLRLDTTRVPEYRLHLLIVNSRLYGALNTNVESKTQLLFGSTNPLVFLFSYFPSFSFSSKFVDSNHWSMLQYELNYYMLFIRHKTLKNNINERKFDCNQIR